ncbi:hypothetical protein [Streptomyces pratensis]|uniref:hypothetical protein n=1 Tax=Streptomyces pratensis TaxID=1169025 RepID=UPI00301A3166
MSTTRHLVNRRRRLATAAPSRTPADSTGPRELETEPRRTPADVDPGADAAPRAADDGGAGAGAEREPDAGPPADGPGEKSRPARRPGRLRVPLPAVLSVLTVLFGAFAIWAFASAGDLRDEPARQNTALTDIGRTSEVKGRISEAVGAVFSYDYAETARSESAASTYLTGRAVEQHREMLADVREQAPSQKLVLTTTVTESAVEFLDGDRARLLIFADQSNTRTGKDEETTYAAAMFAVDAVHREGAWLIAGIDTFTR